MKNAKTEFERHLELVKTLSNENKINSALIHVEHITYSTNMFVLLDNHSMDDYQTFLKYLDFNYDIKSHNLSGYIWFENGNFSEVIYCTNEWEYRAKPDIDKKFEYFKTMHHITQIVTFGTKFKEEDQLLYRALGEKIVKTDKKPQSLGGTLTPYGEIQNLRQILREYLREYQLVYNYYDCSYEDDGSDVKYYLNYLDNKLKNNLKKLREQLEKFEE